MTCITCDLLDGYSCFLKFFVINAALTALNPQSKKHKVILLVGTVYSELTTPTGLGPCSWSWAPGHKIQTFMKQIPQESSCVQAEKTEVGSLLTEVLKKRLPQRREDTNSNF